MNNNIDVCFTFDTTGSMYPCLALVKRSINQIVKKLFSDIPDLRIAIIAHGDYCDAKSTYVTKINDFTNNANEICNFVNNVGPTGGGDIPECYELVLHEARTKLSWQSGRSKVIVMIGDSVPHGPSYPGNIDNIDWRNELGLLLESNINVYGVHAMPGIRKSSMQFYHEIALKTGGFYLTLDQFSTITDLIMAICYKQSSDDMLNAFVNQVEEQGRMTRDFRNSVRTLGLSIADIAYSDNLTPVPAGRFQVLTVDKSESIKDFVTEQGATFKKGRGFYELDKSETIGQYKEIILVDKSSGDIFNGPQVRCMLGLSPQVEKGGVKEKLNTKTDVLDNYKIFIQSTSVTRKLTPGTSLLYEVEDWDS